MKNLVKTFNSSICFAVKTYTVYSMDIFYELCVFTTILQNECNMHTLGTNQTYNNLIYLVFVENIFFKIDIEWFKVLLY